MNACLQLFDFAVDSTDLRVGVQNIGFALVSGLKMNDLLPIFVKSQSIQSYCYWRLKTNDLLPQFSQRQSYSMNSHNSPTIQLLLPNVSLALRLSNYIGARGACVCGGPPCEPQCKNITTWIAELLN